jgi:hypothetical protein
MALSTCRDCNREVSTLARHCVHCGRPRPASSGAGGVLAGVAVVVIALALTAGVICTARRACKKISNRAWAECRVSDGGVQCSFGKSRAADKATFIKSLESEGAELVEVGPGLFRLKPAPALPQGESK